MYIHRNLSWKVIMRFAYLPLIVYTTWNLIVYFLIHFLEHKGINPHIPFLPLSTIGIAVAFYVGFKNNAAYDRFWEARKIWGGIVNYSRTWANQVLQFVTNKHSSSSNISDDEVKEVQKQLIYNHLAWINALRLTLRKPNPNGMKMNKAVKKLRLDAPEDEHWRDEVFSFITMTECKKLYNVINKPTQIIRRQGEVLKELMHDKGLIEDFRHMNMMRVLEEFYNLQGKCERIKNTPFPRQYGYFSNVFVNIFTFLLPFGLLGEFSSMGHDLQVIAIPFSVLISWIFYTMEKVGDSSEDPFENFINDVPMTALCRTIERDLRQMLGETELPPSVEAKDGVLM